MKKAIHMACAGAIGVLYILIYLVAAMAAVVYYLAMAGLDLMWPEDPETMTDDEKRRYYGYRKDL